MTQEALKLALEALENGMKFVWTDPEREACFVAIDAIKEALAQPAQEPYCYVDPVHLAALNTDQSAEVVLHKNPSGYAARGLYTAPQQRTWVGLTDEEILVKCESVPDYDIGNHDLIQFARAIETKLKEKNT